MGTPTPCYLLPQVPSLWAWFLCGTWQVDGDDLNYGTLGTVGPALRGDLASSNLGQVFLPWDLTCCVPRSPL